MKRLMKFIWHLEFNILHSGQMKQKQSCEEGIQGLERRQFLYHKSTKK